MTEIMIGPAVHADAEAILDLQKRAYRSEAELYNNYTIAPLTQDFDSIMMDFQTHTILKATLNGRIVGSVRGRSGDGTCHIGRLIVDPEWQNRGIGTRLLHAIEKHFHQVRRYELFTGDKSVRNLYLYQKLGYRPTRKVRNTESVTHVFLDKPGPG